MQVVQGVEREAGRLQVELAKVNEGATKKMARGPMLVAAMGFKR